MPDVTDRQDCELGASGKVPKNNPPVGTHGQEPVVATDRGEVIIDRFGGDMSERSVFECGIDLVCGQFVPERKDDTAVVAEIKPQRVAGGQAENRTALHGVPQPEAVFPTVARQKFTRRQENRVQAGVGRTFKPCVENAGVSIPQIYVGVVARCRQSRAVWTPGDRRRAGQCKGSDDVARLQFKNPAHWLLRVAIRDRDLEAVRAKRQALWCAFQARLDRPGTSGIQIVNHDLAILMSEDDPAAVRAESGRGPGYWARIVQHNSTSVDIPDCEGEAWKMSGREVVAIRAETKHEDVAVPLCLEAGNLAGTVDVIDPDCPISEP